MNKTTSSLIALVCLWCLSTVAAAQQSETFGPFELHYSVVNTTFLEPAVAATYGITRGKKRAILNLAVRETIPSGTPEETSAATVARTMLLKGKTWDLIQNQTLEFKEIREGDAIYYIAEFAFINEEWRFFEIDFRPAGANETYTFKFKHQLYIN